MGPPRLVAWRTMNHVARRDKPMSNFFDMRCPKCGDEDHIDIAAEVWVRLAS
jgi:ribosomal protein S27E